MRLRNDIDADRMYLWCMGIFVAAVVALSTWTRLAPDRSELQTIEGRLERVTEVWFGRKTRTRAFGLHIRLPDRRVAVIYLHEGSVYDHARNTFDIGRIEALVGKDVIAQIPPPRWSVSSLYEKRVLSLAADGVSLLTYDGTTRSQRWFHWWLAGVAVAILLMIMIWRHFLGASVAKARVGPDASLDGRA